ncbi:hypothetical protein Pflav_010580 [Phytohabitans flavus]|uniref:Uncharacterized protein n=1 Tax=Phytohabitans flavus TaxID=1076124 RepID=A0A6F8XLH3_9ACTN|nr:peptidase inhibitor family I36 protein [Phytohabitans flavus]BCB74648.1 hypothetical protein Pflav_010580 [Phytohabitans flavus]
MDLPEDLDANPEDPTGDCDKGQVCVFSGPNFSAEKYVLLEGSRPVTFTDLTVHTFPNGELVNDRIVSIRNRSDLACLFTANSQDGNPAMADVDTQSGVPWENVGGFQLFPRTKESDLSRFRLTNVFSSVVCQAEPLLDDSGRPVKPRQDIDPDFACADGKVCGYQNNEFNGQAFVFHSLAQQPFNVRDFEGLVFPSGTPLDGNLRSFVNNTDRKCVLSALRQTGEPGPVSFRLPSGTHWTYSSFDVAIPPASRTKLEGLPLSTKVAAIHC